jgi:hypothetical protein
MKALDIAAERAGSKATLQSLLDADCRVKSLMPGLVNQSAVDEDEFH